MRYFLRLSYNGAPFCGWQRQPNAVSVQQTIEEALQTVFRSPIPIVGAGRTDTGVHAACMYAHFDLPTPLKDKGNIIKSLNHLCGKNIAIYSLIEVDDNAHARFDAISRTYKYYISHRKNPFNSALTWYINSPLDYEKMNQAARLLLEIDDFTSFAKLHSDAKTNICDVREAYWRAEKDDVHVFTITADRFLRNMVRAVVGTLIEVGRGKMDIDRFKAVIQERDRCAAGMSVPAHGLFLYNIVYPYPLL